MTTTYENPNALLDFRDVGDHVELSWTETGSRRHHATVERATGEATIATDAGGERAVTADDGRVLQQALNQSGEPELGRKVFDRYTRDNFTIDD